MSPRRATRSANQPSRPVGKQRPTTTRRAPAGRVGLAVERLGQRDVADGAGAVPAGQAVAAARRAAAGPSGSGRRSSRASASARRRGWRAPQLGVQEVVGDERRQASVEPERSGARPQRLPQARRWTPPPRATTLLRSGPVARTWQAMFRYRRGRRRPNRSPTEAGRGLFSRLRENLSRSRRAMAQQLAGVMFNPADDAVWERLEEALLLSDCGVPATVAVIERLEAEADAGRLTTAEELSTRAPGDHRRADDTGGGSPHRHHRPSRRPARERRERHGQDDLDRQDRLAPARGRPHVRDRRRRHLPGGRRRAARDVGAAGRGRLRLVAVRRRPGRASRSTPSPPPRPAAATSSSSTPPGGCTPRAT